MTKAVEAITQATSPEFDVGTTLISYSSWFLICGMISYESYPFHIQKYKNNHIETLFSYISKHTFNNLNIK